MCETLSKILIALFNYAPCSVVMYACISLSQYPCVVVTCIFMRACWLLSSYYSSYKACSVTCTGDESELRDCYISYSHCSYCSDVVGITCGK